MLDLNERHLSCQLGVLSKPDGSALLCQGGTVVLAGVYAPIEAKAQKLLIDKANVEVNYRPKAGQPGVGDRLNESIIRNTCETAIVASLFPRSSIMINIQEMQNTGERPSNLLACVINAASLALVESDIDLKFMVAAVSCALNSDGITDLNNLPISTDEPGATFVFAFDSVNKQVLAAHTTGSFSLQEYQEALEFCRIQCEQIFEFFKTTVTNHVQ